MICKYPSTDFEPIPLDMALMLWRDHPKVDKYVCLLQRAIFLFLHETMEKQIQEYKRLRKVYATELIDTFKNLNKPKAQPNAIYELMLHTHLVWCDSTNENVEEITRMLTAVRGICERLKLDRHTASAKQTTPCEQWHELIHYLLSLLDLPLSMGKDYEVTLYETLDWTGKFSLKEALSILKSPQAFLQQKYHLTSPLTLQFDYFAWFKANHATLDKLPNPHDMMIDAKQKKCHMILTALAISVWIIRRLSRFVVLNVIES
jgi:hypothetical protein